MVTKKGEDKGVVNVQNMGNNRVKHWGKYHKKEFNVGRAVPYTGLWDCCGDETELSLYCLPKRKSKRSMHVWRLESASWRRRKCIGRKS